MIFVDTSAFVAIADETDDSHRIAMPTFERLVARGDALWTHNYVVTEAMAVIQRKVGLESALKFQSDVGRIATVYWVNRQDHEKGAELLKARNRRGLSLVDCVSFVLMKERRCKLAFAFDEDFRREGFESVSRADTN